MTNLFFAAGNNPAIGIIYALGVLLVIAVVCFAVVKLFGGSPRTRGQKRGAVGAREEQIDANDGTPHTFDR